MEVTKRLVDKSGMEKLYSGIDKMANAVKSTLGPFGRNVLIQDEYGNVTSTKDGVTVAKKVRLEDPLENLAATVLREVSVQTNDVVGDGTTTAVVLAQAMIQAARKLLSRGESVVSVRDLINSDVEKLCAYIDEKKIDISLEDRDTLGSVAAISTNNDTVIGNLLAEAFISVGEGGIVTVQEGMGTETYFQHNEGISFNRGFVSASFVNNQRNRSWENENCRILLIPEKIKSTDEILTFLENNKSIVKDPILIVCEDIDDKAMSLLLINVLKGILNICVIKTPGINLDRAEILQDIAAAVDAQIVSLAEIRGFNHQILGFAESIKVNDGKTTIIGGRKNEEVFNERLEVLAGQIEATEEKFLKERIAQRIARLKGGVGVIYAGGSSELEIKEKVDRIDDGIHALQAALEDGVIQGGGTLLVKTISDGLEMSILDDVILAPLKQILENADYEEKEKDAVISDLVTNQKFVGYDVTQDSYTLDILASGIIDSAKVLKSALRNAASVATLFISTEYVISNTEFKTQD